MYELPFRKTDEKVYRKYLDMDEAYKYKYDSEVEPMPLLINSCNTDTPDLINNYLYGFETLDNQLYEITKTISEEYQKFAKLYMTGQIFLCNVEVDFEVKIYAHIDELDPLYREDEDDILLILYDSQQISRSNLKVYPLINTSLGADNCTIKEFSNFKNCYAFHSLYDHTSLDLFNLLRIDRFTFDFDINVTTNAPIKHTKTR
ncbi:hypothetical protein AB9G23_06635 [Francisella philomiragia]|uniref:hypothetical protein n=1 Tax=Francisella philomiragia TaxID=28110 RepID=UPI001905B5A5|nr:hypothetical protein [Francisella philomiragia]MBK2025845.1 hypothetical protein [Francisella philomiragia]